MSLSLKKILPFKEEPEAIAPHHSLPHAPRELNPFVLPDLVSLDSPQEEESQALSLARDTVNALREGHFSSPSERHNILETLREFSGGPIFQVRVFLSSALSDFTTLDWGLFRSILDDEECIALPFLEKTQALESRRMLLIAQMRESLQNVLAARSDLTLAAAWVLITIGSRDVVMTLLNNPAIALEPQHYEKIYERFTHDDSLVEHLLSLPYIPPTIRLLELEHVTQKLREVFSQSDPEIQTSLSRCQERGILGLLFAASPQQRESLFDLLDHHDLLTPALLLRAACSGRLDLMEHLLGWILSLPLQTVRYFTQSRSRFLLKTLYWASGFPKETFLIFYHALKILRRLTPEQRLNHDAIAERLLSAVIRDAKKLSRKKQAALLTSVRDLTAF